MNDRSIAVLSAHPDDWQLFAGAEIYRHARERQSRVGVITLTAGEGRHGDYHWQSRHSGAVLSLARALPAWNPYDEDALPQRGYAVTFESLDLRGHVVLRTTIDDGRGPDLLHYALHLPDAGKRGPEGRPGASLADLKAGTASLQPVWPERSAPYTSWDDLLEVLRELIDDAAQGSAGVRLYAHDYDQAGNVNDHPDHACAGMLAHDLAKTDGRLSVSWFAGYDVRLRDANLDSDSVNLQRAAIFAYAGGYTAHAAELTDEWPHGWEREFEAFGGRQYLRDE